MSENTKKSLNIFADLVNISYFSNKSKFDEPIDVEIEKNIN